MSYSKKSLGQNFLIDNNIIKKIVNLTEIKNKNIIEIGPGKGALTNEILKKKPNSLILIEKDFKLVDSLKSKYVGHKNISIYNADILSIDLEKIIKKDSTIYGNLPFNISSQILVKILKQKRWPPNYKNLIFMFQKELGEKILGNYKSTNYGRLSIFRNLRLDYKNKFFVSPSCFAPEPKVTSMVIHFKPKINKYFSKIDPNCLEKITNIIFSNKRKMINKAINKVLDKKDQKKVLDLKLNSRPSELSPDVYYRITELYQKKQKI